MQEMWVQPLSQEDSPGEGNGNSLQYSCLRNSMDRGARWRDRGVQGGYQVDTFPGAERIEEYRWSQRVGHGLNINQQQQQK